ncbi:MAG: YmdB family metallophosphoesterase [Clostridia bacterium]|nr:YmdB family metallophosphoesterase [Clostridia bacterium]
MRILFIGDVVGAPGCAFLRQTLPAFKKHLGIDFCIANGENSAPGNGITPASYARLLESGVDLVTGGNHTLRRAEIYDTLDARFSCALRPANLHRTAPGRGMTVLEKGGLRLGVANLLGSVYMDYAENPFDAADEAVRFFAEQRVFCTLLDFHAEATSEKRAIGFYLDGRMSAVIGTHTHVQTADEQILPGGTAYITDAGMTGVKQSVLGVKTESATQKMRTGLPVRFEPAEGACEMQCAAVELDYTDGRAKSIERFCIT